MLDPKQTGRFSSGEIELIKKTFGGDGRVLNALRGLLWQFELTEEEKKMVQFSGDVLALLKKSLLPSPSLDIPLFQNVSMYQSLSRIRDMNYEPAMLQIQANDLLVQYIKQQFNELVTGNAGTQIILAKLPLELGNDQGEIRYINMLSYHNIGGYIEGRINELNILANPPAELTPEELKAKLKKDSSR